MADRGKYHWMTCILVLALFAGPGMFPSPAVSAQLPFDGDEQEDISDMEYVRHQAEAGKARFQTRLGDHYLGSSDFTNAVVWYRKAAAQGHVPAQLSLAGCLLSGRGVPRSPNEAARWLRQAADQIESGSATGKVAQAQASRPPALPVQSKAALPRVGTTNAVPPPDPKFASAVPSNSSPRPPAQGAPGSTRLPRATTLISSPATLQEAPFPVKPPVNAR